MSRLALLAGVSGSGKTTFARTLEARGFVRLSIDEVVWGRGGDWAAEAPRAEDELVGVLVAHLTAGRDVVLDYPLCQRAARDRYRGLAADLGATTELFWFEAPREVLHARVAARASSPGPNAFPASPEQLDRYLGHAQPPEADERAVVNPS